MPAALVNSGLKYMQKRIKLSFQRRLVSVCSSPALHPRGSGLAAARPAML